MHGQCFEAVFFVHSTLTHLHAGALTIMLLITLVLPLFAENKQKRKNWTSTLQQIHRKHISIIGISTFYCNLAFFLSLQNLQKLPSSAVSGLLEFALWHLLNVYCQMCQIIIHSWLEFSKICCKKQ